MKLLALSILALTVASFTVPAQAGCSGKATSAEAPAPTTGT